MSTRPIGEPGRRFPSAGTYSGVRRVEVAEGIRISPSDLGKTNVPDVFIKGKPEDITAIMSKFEHLIKQLKGQQFQRPEPQRSYQTQTLPAPPSSQFLPRPEQETRRPEAEPRPQPERGPPPAPGAGGSPPPPSDVAVPVPSEGVEPPPSSETAPLPSEGKKPAGLVPPPKGGEVPGHFSGPQPQLPRGGLSDAQKAQIVEQVVIASLLFNSGRAESRERPASIAQTSSFLRQVDILDRGFTELARQIRQLTEGGKSLSPEQKKAMNAALNTLVKQFEALQKQAQGILGQAAMGAGAAEAAMEDPLKAAMALKAKSDLLLNQVQGRLEGKLAELAQQIAAKGSATAALMAAKEGEEQAAGASNSSPSAQGEKAAKAVTISQAAESSVLSGSEAKPSAKPPTQLPPVLHSAADLSLAKQLVDKKELAAPFNIALVYPLDKKEQSQNIQGTKTEKTQEKKGENSRSSGEGGGHTLAMTLIPKGPAIIEGPFLGSEGPQSEVMELESYLISTFPITNEQFADWLNEALGAQKIKMNEKRVVFDPSGNIICSTHWAASSSQIQVDVAGEGLAFRPLKGTEKHPVVQVSFLGALAFCKDNGLRLPTEPEFEKAGAAPIFIEGETLTKFRYGFGKDEIDLSYANYRDELREYEDNRTLPVGFYNGETVFTKKGKNYQSRNACSPHGCYDMSGNVRQWVTAEGELKQAIAKGGSYNSPPEELFISARALFSPNACNAETGFRVVIDL